MLAAIATVASILAAGAAVFAFGLGVTRTARLRRREQLFREALSVLDGEASCENVVGDLHRAALAELVAMQLTPPWRVIWPWACWLGIAALAGQTGYQLADYLASDAEWDYDQFSLKVFGDTLAPVLLIGGIFGVLPMVFLSLAYTLEGRAEVARNFFDGKGIAKPTTYMRRSVELDYSPRPPKPKHPAGESRGARIKRRIRSFWSGLVVYLSTVVPGMFVIALGLTVGMSWWLREHADQKGRGRDEYLESLGAFPALMILSMTILGTLTLGVGTLLKFKLEDYALPNSFPRSRLSVVRRPARRRQSRSVSTDQSHSPPAT